MKPPSTEWREEPAPDEEARFRRFAEQLTAIQERRSRKQGSGRALHRKQVLGLAARLEVLPDLPPHARHGLFAKAGTHEAWVRLSNGSMNKQPDRTPDIRGFAIKVLGVSGPGALGGETSCQDFLLINREAFSSPKSEEFFGLVIAADKGPRALLGHFIRSYGLLAGLRRVRRLSADMKRPFSGFATERFHSAVPLACGPYAVRVRLLPAAPATSVGAGDDWAADLKRRLASGPLVHELQLQFFVDEAVTPIEDASVVWPESEAPYLTVARLTLPPQDTEGEVAKTLGEKVEQAAFDPWKALAEHRPLGDVMRARKVTYYASAQKRGAAP
jgi:hypothetical protein